MTREFGPRLCFRWTRWYTRHLPDDIASQRRAEIASDLWEHRRDSTLSNHGQARHNLDVIGRLLCGVPADLSWRRAIVRSRGQAFNGGPGIVDRFNSLADHALIVLVAVGVFPASALAPLLGSAVANGGSANEIGWVFGAIVLAMFLVGGIVLRLAGTHPILSTLLLVAGSAAPSVAVFWLPPVYLLTAAIAVLALITIPRQARTAVQ